MKHEQLYQELIKLLSAHLKQATRPQIRNLALMTLSLAYSPNCHLATLANAMPIEGQRENVVQRIRRWLGNEAVTQERCYKPLVKQVFEHWPHREVGLVMDRTDLEDRLSVLLVGAAYHHRVLPLAWKVLSYGATNAETQEALMEQVRPTLPKQARITFYGDSEFRAVKLQRYCQKKGWSWQVGLKSGLLFRREGGDWRALRTIDSKPEERRYLHAISLTRKHAFGPVNLMVDWNSEEDSPRYVATDQVADRLAWRRGRKRFRIEPTFRDWKSYGFDVEKSHLVHKKRLQTLLLAIAVTTLWMIHIGCWVDATGRRVSLEAPHKRDYSIFRRGRDYVIRALVQGGPLPVGVTVQ